MCYIAAVCMEQIDDKVFPFTLLLTWIYVFAMFLLSLFLATESKP